MSFLLPLAALLLPGPSPVFAASLLLPGKIAVPAAGTPQAAAEFFGGGGSAMPLSSWEPSFPPISDVVGEAAGPATPTNFLTGSRTARLPAAGPATLRFNGLNLPRVLFTSQGSVGSHIVSAIDHTKKDLKLALYDFNLREILAALQRATQREDPVRIRVVLDQRHVHSSRGPPSPEIQAIIDAPLIEVRMIRGLRSFGTMHNKIGVFDDKLVTFGSFNWGWAAETMHYENIVFSSDPDRVAAYRDYWRWMWDNAWPTDTPRSSPKELGPPPADSSRPVDFNGTEFPGAVFSPEGGAAGWILDAVRRSKKTIDIAMFNFSSKDLAEALLERKNAGVKISIVMDRRQTGGSSVIGFLRENGFEVKVMGGREGRGAMHHKFAIFDGKMVETGAYNWSWNAEANSFENINFLGDSSNVAAYQEEFAMLHAKSIPIDKALLLQPLPPLSALGHPDLE